MADVNPMDLIFSLVGYPNETVWLEFKENYDDADRLAKDISALANAAAYHGRDVAYKIWGVSDGDHSLKGTSFDPLTKKAKGNQDLLIWLKQHMSANANYEFEQIADEDDKKYVVLKICAANVQPVCFNEGAYIREGSSTTPLKRGSSGEVELWRRLQRSGFEQRISEEDVPAVDIASRLNVDEFFQLLDIKQPVTLEGYLKPLDEQDIVKSQDGGSYSITNLGALLLARKLSSFAGLRKRALRVVRFAGNGNFEILEDKTFDEGYALALPKAKEYIMSITPSVEVTEGAFRRIKTAYPEKAVRELLSNAVIHQDLTIPSAGPLVAIYDNRIEFSNPGSSLISLDRVLNAQPKTRNNELVGLLRQMDLCEEGGTGWDIAVAACENAHIASPKIENVDDSSTKATLFRDVSYERMTKQERVSALYWHTCLMYAQGESMSNQSLRERFGLPDEKKNGVAISRLIRECSENGLIKEEDSGAGPKYRRYIPAWA